MRANASYSDTKLVLLRASAGRNGSVRALSVRLTARGIPHLVDDQPTALISAAAPAPPSPLRISPGRVWLWVPEPAAASAEQVIGEWAANPSLEALESAPIRPEDLGPGCWRHGDGDHFWPCPRCARQVCEACGGAARLPEGEKKVCRACAYRAFRAWSWLDYILVGLVVMLAAGCVGLLFGKAGGPRVLLDRAQQGLHRVLGR